MKIDTRVIESRLRSAATLLMALPTLVALACFAHGHGTLGSSGLLATLILAVGAGAVGAYQLLSLTRRKAVMFDTNPDFGVVPAAVSRHSK